MKKILLLPLVLSLFSCKAIMLKIFTSDKSIADNIKVLYNKERDQKIVFFPMTHIGQKEYYESAREMIDSLRANDYSFYYENIAIPKNTGLDSNEVETYHKKTRKILGYHPLLDTNNRSLPDIYKKNDLKIQDYRFMGLRKEDDRLDLSKDQIIDSIEANYDEIKLTKCDIDTPLSDEYDCQVLDKYKWALTNEFRDPYITNRILGIKKKKIALIYGKMHWLMIWPELNKAGFELIKGKI